MRTLLHSAHLKRPAPPLLFIFPLVLTFMILPASGEAADRGAALPLAADPLRDMESGSSKLPEDIKTVSHSIEAPADTRMSEKSRILEDGSVVTEYYNELKLRTEKTRRDSEGRILERWLFDPLAQGRITIYETYDYHDGTLESFRTASWAYEPEGNAVKTNRMYKGNGEQTGYTLEYLGPEDKKFREEWYDETGQPKMVKLWDKETGNFLGHILLKPAQGKWRQVEWADENRRTVKKAIIASVDLQALERQFPSEREIKRKTFREMSKRDSLARRPQAV